MVSQSVAMLQIKDRAQFVGYVRIVIIDPDSQRRAQLCARFDQESTTTDALASIADLDRESSDPNVLVVYDNGQAVAKALAWSRDLVSPVPVLAYCASPRVAQVVEAMKAGACNYLEWPIVDAAIEEIIEQALEVSEQAARTEDRKLYAKWAIEKLTSRERQVLLALSKGLTSQQIAEDLMISARTVETHRYNLRGKLGSISTAEALRLIFEHELGGRAP